MMISAESATILQEPLLLFPALVATFTARGFARALAAKLLGDPTPSLGGFLTINPAAHVDTLATLVLVAAFTIFDLLVPIRTITTFFFLIVIAVFGPRWRTPVPINPHNLKKPARDLALIGLAGSLGNFLCALTMFYVVRIADLLISPTIIMKTLAQMGLLTADISIFFGILFLLPIPPLDGSLILAYLIPSSERLLAKLAAHSLLVMIILWLLLEAIVFVPFILIKFLILKLVFF